MPHACLKFFCAEDRLSTFKNFKPIAGAPLCTPVHLANSGFINISTRKFPDLVKCFACGKELGNWEEGDDPWQEHVKRGQKCPFVLYKSKNGSTVEDFVNYFLSVKIFEIESVMQADKDEVTNSV